MAARADLLAQTLRAVATRWAKAVQGPLAARGHGSGERTASTRALPVVVDAGAGTGYYGAAVLDALRGGQTGLAFDISKSRREVDGQGAPRMGASGGRVEPAADLATRRRRS
ncbi:hypothetical protein GCM10020219_015890 [Nonomuraea dietziae]